MLYRNGSSGQQSAKLTKTNLLAAKFWDCESQDEGSRTTMVSHY